MWSLPRYADDMLSHTETLNNSIMRFTEAQIKSSDTTCKIIKTLNFFNVNFNNNENNGYRNDVGALNRFYANGLSILSYRNYAVDDRVFVLTLFYKKQFMHIQELFHMLQYLLATNSILFTIFKIYDLSKM